MGIKVAYIGTALPYQLFLKVASANAAGNLAERGIIEALHTSGIGLDRVISFWPISPFPNGRILFRRGQVAEVVPMVRTRFFPLVNIYPFRNWLRYAFLALYLLAWRVIRFRHQCVVVVYNLFFPNALYLRCITWLLGIKMVPVVFDCFSPVTLKRPWYKRVFEPMWFLRVCYSMIRQADGRMVITENIARDFAPGLSYMVLDGGVTQQVVESLFPLKISSHEEFILLFAGSIHPIEHIDVLLEYMRQNPDPTLRLWLAGRLEYPPVLEAVKNDARITYKGILKINELFDCYEQVDALVCLRDTCDPVLKYHFPAKTLECLAVGKPYITTNASHTRTAYGDYCFVVDAPDVQSLGEAVRTIRQMSKEERVTYGIRARDFTMKYRTWRSRGPEIRKYIEMVCEQGAVTR